MAGLCIAFLHKPVSILIDIETSFCINARLGDYMLLRLLSKATTSYLAYAMGSRINIVRYLKETLVLNLYKWN